MILRKLQQKDAPFMLDWMHDESVIENMQANFATKTLEDCISFIEESQHDKNNLHLAIVNDTDTYMGTVSLKHIQNGSAEFAIALRKVAMSKGYSKYAMAEIIRIGLKDLNLNQIYWCVSPENRRAVRFYEKNGYQQINEVDLQISAVYTIEKSKQYLWYIVK